jgi:hypothetical protein
VHWIGAFVSKWSHIIMDGVRTVFINTDSHHDITVRGQILHVVDSGGGKERVEWCVPFVL